VPEPGWFEAAACASLLEIIHFSKIRAARHQSPGGTARQFGNFGHRTPKHAARSLPELRVVVVFEAYPYRPAGLLSITDM
jgi:hypothetical protein